MTTTHYAVIALFINAESYIWFYSGNAKILVDRYAHSNTNAAYVLYPQSC